MPFRREAISEWWYGWCEKEPPLPLPPLPRLLLLKLLMVVGALVFPIIPATLTLLLLALLFVGQTEAASLAHIKSASRSSTNSTSGWPFFLYLRVESTVDGRRDGWEATDDSQEWGGRKGEGGPVSEANTAGCRDAWTCRAGTKKVMVRTCTYASIYITKLCFYEAACIVRS